MKKNKVIAQLMALPPKEFRRFGKFVRNPANNKKEVLIRLYQFVANNHPDYEERKFTKAQCFLYVFPELEYQYERLNGIADELVSKKLKNPLYEFKNLIEDFIVQQELAVQSHEKTMLLIRGLFNRQMNDKAFELIDKELKRLQGMVGDDFYHHFYQFQLCELKINNTIDKVNISTDWYSNLHNNADLFFAHFKIKYGYEVKTRNNLLGENLQIQFFEYVKKTLDQRLIPNVNLTIKLYGKICNLNEYSTIDDFLKVKDFYFNNFSELCKKEKKEPLIYLLNFAVQEYQKGKKKYLEEMFDLFKFGLEKDVLKENGFLSSIDFKNIVVASTTLEKYDWAKKFIQQNACFLKEAVRKSIVLIASAQIEDCQGNNKKVIDLLRDAEFFDVYDNLMARTLLMRAYYNLKEVMSLNSFLESFYKYVKRNKSIGEDEKIPWINMIQFTKKLLAKKYSTSDKAALKFKLKNLGPVNSKTWLLNKIDQL